MSPAADRVDGVVIESAPAKVNLFLELLARRPDGYHALETLMVAVSLADTLSCMSADSLILTCSDRSLSTGRDNLVLKAAAALQRHTGTRCGAAMHLTKRIPSAAGLAGGSSDAAAALRALNRLWNLRLTRLQLAAIAAEVGSDVAFFLSPPAAWCTGRGEAVEPVRPGARLHLVLVCPAEGISTAAVYRRCRVPASPRSGDSIRAAFVADDLVTLGKELFNRLQEPAEGLCPRLGELQQIIARLHPPGCLMSGSGSTLFALCSDHRGAVRLASRLRAELTDKPQPRVYVVRSLIPESSAPV